MAATTAEGVEKYQFDDFDLLPKQRVLLRSGSRIPLTPKPLMTLLLLVGRAGQTVTKEEIFAEVWNGTTVDENNLTQSISALRKALGEKRGENRYIVTDPGRGYRFVAPVSRVLEQTSVVSGEPAAIAVPSPARTGSRNRLLAFGAVALLLTAGAAWWLWHGATLARAGRQSIAVLRIRDLSKTPSESWLQTALAEMLTSEIAAGRKLRTIPAEDVARWRADLGPSGNGEWQAVVLRSARNNLGADEFVIGSYVVTGICPQCRIRVDLGVVQARSGERVATVTEEGSAADLLDLAARLGYKLRAELGVKAETATASRWPAASAMREYSEGLAALRQGDPISARTHLEAAVAADAQNALIHSALADAWMSLGYIIRANEEDRRAYDLAGSLDRLDQLGVEARYRVSVKDWNRAIEIYKTIFRLFPDSLNDGLNLARAQWRAQRVSDATATLNELRRLRRPLGNDPRIDLTEAQAVGTLNDFPRTRMLAHRAAEEAKSRGARYVYARARLLEGGAMQSLSDANCIAVQDEARQTCESIGDRSCVSQAWRVRGNYYDGTGNFQAAQQAYLRGIAIARELGNGVELANLLVGTGMVEKANREWQAAERDLQEAISLKVETGYNASHIRNSLAEFYLNIGRYRDAETLLASAAHTMEESGAYEDIGDMLLLQSMLARLRGQLDAAERLGERSVAELRRAGNPLSLRLALAEMSSQYAAEGKLAEAEKNLAEAGAGDWPEDQGAVQFAKAELSIVKGRYQDAASAAQKAGAAFDKARLDDRAARAFVTAADALDILNRNSDARAACAEAEKLAALTPNEVSQAMARICLWRVSTDHETAGFQADIAKLHAPELILDLDFARALRAKRAGAANARALAHNVAAEAGKLGYVTLSRRAAALAQ